MRRNRYYALLMVALSALFGACTQFLDVKPKGVLLPERLEDYEAMLNSPTMTRTFPINLLDFTDDVFNSFDELNQSPGANGYYWRNQLTINEKVSPDVWGPLYRVIYSANVIINGAPNATEATAPEIRSVTAEALVVRAACYLDLLTVFAKAYNPSTAAADPGLPLVTSISVTDKVPDRSTLKATVDSLISDVTTAVEWLPPTNINRYRASEFAAYGLLARIFLYMGDYENARTYVDLALSAPHQLLNYNDYEDRDGIPVSDLNPEILWQRTAVSGSPLFMLYSEDLKNHFDDSDIRYEFLTLVNNFGLGRSSLPGAYNFGITFPEMYLTKAELLAREGQIAPAMDLVNLLRKNRVRADSYADQTATDPEEALAKVLAERRRELAFCGPRWFDMKRLDREGRMPEVQRVNPEDHSVEASLPPGSPNYTFEIPIRVSMFNPGMELNHP